MSDNGNYRSLSTELASSDHNLLYQHGQIPSQKPQNKRPITSGIVAITQVLPIRARIYLLIFSSEIYSN